MNGRSGLQILLPVPAKPPLVAGVPAVLRTAHDLAASRDVYRILLCTEASGFVESWRRCLTALPWTEVASRDGSSALTAGLDADGPVLLVRADGMPDATSFGGFLDASQKGRGPTAWIWNGSVVAAYYPEARGLLETLPSDGLDPREPRAHPDARRFAAPHDSWESFGTSDGVERAEQRLFHSLRKESDGYLARFDRSVSIALSRRLIRTSVSPNAITTVSLIVGLVGAALLASPTYWVALVGAALLWASCVLDGCDGEVARLRLRTSRFGARYDVITDNIVHVAIFMAIAVHVSRTRPELHVALAATALIGGVFLSMLSVWWLILREPEASRAGLQRFYERIASRDFIYVIVVLTAVDRLEWFLWSAAIGANLFWMSLWWFSRRARST